MRIPSSHVRGGNDGIEALHGVQYALCRLLTSRAALAASSVTPLDDRRIVPAMKSWADCAASSEMPLEDRRWEAPVGRAVVGLLSVAIVVLGSMDWNMSNRMKSGRSTQMEKLFLKFVKPLRRPVVISSSPYSYTSEGSRA